MKLKHLLATALLVALSQSLLARPARAQETPSLMTPTKEHEELAHEVGVWDAESSMWMTPDADPEISKGVETNKMMGKFWLVSEYVGEMMGEKFEGRSLMTFDPVKKQYIGTWCDTMAPLLFTLTGKYDAAAHKLTMDMEGVDPMTGKPAKWQTITTYTDQDSKTFELHVPGEDGKFWKTMEIKYKRRK